MNKGIVQHPQGLERLWNLPAKVARPLEELVEREHISNGALTFILDAADLSGQPHKLLGFAVSFHHLRMNGIPVDDVIRMAKLQGRRIRLDWKPKRWQAEHERLSRAETLQKLSAENVSYDLSKFEPHLPSRFPGYLIRTSLRLGMEGLRQRHCIASYHDQIVAGYTAIAVVFVDGERWTVELRNHHDPVAPIRVTQVKSRYNKPASALIRNQVYDALQIEKPKANPLEYGQGLDAGPRERRFRHNLRDVLPVLREHGVTHVVVHFDGSGDSGSVDGANYKTEHGEFNAQQTMVNLTTVDRSWDEANSCWRSEVAYQTADVDTAIDQIVEEYLDSTGVDWCNNDGGYGTFEIDVAAGTCSMEVEVRYTESTTEFSNEFDIETDEDIDAVDEDVPALPRPNAA